MDAVSLTVVALLVVAGLGAGFIAGLVGVGGGIIFTPVLFAFYATQDVPSAVVTPLTIGSGLLCTGLASAVSAWSHDRRGAVDRRMALGVGLASAVAVVAVTRGIVTQLWYDATVFQLLFAAVLLVVVVRMVRDTSPSDASDAVDDLDDADGAATASHGSWASWGITGTAAGAVASAVGVGGGVVLVPAYARGFGVPMHRAVGTSSATIVLISLLGVATYVVTGWNVPGRPATALGYVDVGRALLLAGPALVAAHIGASVAHRVDTHRLRLAFAVLAVVVAGRLVWNAL